MFNKSIAGMLIIAAAMLTPAPVDAYGAGHVGYTHVGPTGVQHYGATEVRSPYGSYGGAHYGATGYGGAHYGTTEGYHAGYGGAAVGTTGYHYTTGASAGAYGYAYVR